MIHKSYTSEEAAVKCSFCFEMFTSETIREHLMQCGNKTEQCPNCEKFIRRAIFTYHYENSCADLDENENRITSTKKQNSTNNSGQTRVEINLESESNTQSNIVAENRCVYCQQEYPNYFVRQAHQMICGSNNSSWSVIGIVRWVYDSVFS